MPTELRPSRNPSRPRLVVALLAGLVGAGVVACSDATPSSSLAMDEAAATTSAPTYRPSADTWSLFTAAAYPALQERCASCHASATGSGRRFLGATAEESYARLDAYRLVTEGESSNAPTPLEFPSARYHSGIPQTAPTAPASQLMAWQAALQTWLSAETKARNGTLGARPALEQLTNCVTDEIVAASGIAALRTKARTARERQTCTGCDRTPCAACHGNGFPDLLSGYLVGSGPDGLVRTDRIEEMRRVWAPGMPGGPENAHPYYELPADLGPKLDAASAALEARRASGACGF